MISELNKGTGQAGDVRMRPFNMQEDEDLPQRSCESVSDSVLVNPCLGSYVHKKGGGNSVSNVLHDEGSCSVTPYLDLSNEPRINQN